MSVEFIEVVDTAVKIGLGALITGCINYSSNKQKYRHEIEKEQLRRNLDLIQEAALEVDTYLHNLNSFISVIDGLIIEHPELEIFDNDMVEHIRDNDFELTQSRASIHSASSKLYLLDATETMSILREIFDIEDNLRTKVVLHSKTISNDELKSHKKSILDVKLRFFKSLSQFSAA